MFKLIRHNHIDIHISNTAVNDYGIIVLKNRTLSSFPPFALSSFLCSIPETVKAGFVVYFELHPISLSILSFNILHSSSITSNLLRLCFLRLFQYTASNVIEGACVSTKHSYLI